MSITVTLTFETAEDVAAYFAAQLPNTGRVRLAQAIGATFAPAAVSAEEKQAAAGNGSAAKTARSPRTAEVAPSTPAPSAAAPEQSTTPPAPAPSPATPAADPAAIPYTDLQKVVIELHSIDATKTKAIATSLGVGSFKELPAARWAEAKALVDAALVQAKSASEVA